LIVSQTSIPPVSFRLNEADPAAFAAALGVSFERHGFAVVADHGIDEAISSAMLADAKAFFALPENAKSRYRVAGGAGQRGYTPFAVETAKDSAHADLKEFWHVGRETDQSRGPLLDNLWPDEIPAFRSDALALYDAFEAFGGETLAAIGAYLGLTAGFLEQAVRGGNSILRLLHYPPSEFEGAAVRAGPHEDINAITLLLGADEAGLELLNRDGSWLPVNPPPGAVVVNIGDMLARLTNDVLPSTTHRVVNPAPERRGVARYSMPFFLHFRPDFLIRTLPECVSAERPDRYPEPITADDFLQRRLREIRLT
jgi:isopenicillin N synthase-like dioxygenase